MTTSSLHTVLVSRQPDAELERKAMKARQRGIWTQEEIDWIERKTDRYMEFINKHPWE